MSNRSTFEIGVPVALFNADGEVLMELRSNTDRGEGLWALPGGALERDESIEECAAREAGEETGIVIAAKDVRLVSVINCGEYVVVFTWAPVYHNQQPINREPAKRKALRWFALSQLPKESAIFGTATVDVIETAARRRLAGE